jgi:hypothetical protein
MTGTNAKRIPYRLCFVLTQQQRTLACSLLSFIATAQFIAVAKSKPSTDTRHTPSVRRHLADKRRLAAKRVLFRPLNRSFTETGEARNLFSPSPRQHVITSGLTPVSPFVVVHAPGTTRQCSNGPVTALQRFRFAPANSYLGHSPRERLLNHHADKAWHRLSLRQPHSFPG